MWELRNRRKELTALGILVLGTAAIAWAPATRADHRPASLGAMGCVINLTAQNNGSSDVWLMLYDSQVRRTVFNTSAFGPWLRLKIQNHRVAPGATIKRSWTDDGGCRITREFRWKLKQGSNFHTTTTRLFVGNGNGEDLGDVSRFF